MTAIRFPNMRNEIIRALEALADPEYQRSAWVERRLPSGHYDEFDHRIHILYDDTEVLEDPDAAIGAYLESQGEADALWGLRDALEALFGDVGTDLSDEDYLRAPGWGAVVRNAQQALAVMKRKG